MKILLVSSNRAVTDQIRAAFLGTPGLEVVVVRGPRWALAHLDEGGAFDLVVADSDTHPSGGLHLAREIRARAQMGAAMPPVVLLLARHQDTWLANWAQADAYVVKPVDPFDLAEVAGALVNRQPVPALPGIGADPGTSPFDLPAGEPGTVR